VKALKIKSTEIIKEIDKDSFRQNLRRFTWQAYGVIPAIANPKILDLGCGTGMVALELAVLSKGYIEAVDKDRVSLAILKEKACVLRLSKNIRIKKRSFEKLNSRSGFFDIVWSEGAISEVGFENGIRSWRRFLKTEGYMVIHDEIREYKRKMELIPVCGFELIKYFVIPIAVWLNEYFKPLEDRIISLKTRHASTPEIIEFLEREECEIEIFKQSPELFASVFFIMKKKG
jgi:ubiquinone/menaquinone biosynthesis C-methylase UbiE